MAKVKNRPDLWRPKRGQWFDAYVNQYGNLARGAPFKCIDYDSVRRIVDASDTDGFLRGFSLREFSLEPVKSR